MKHKWTPPMELQLIFFEEDEQQFMIASPALARVIMSDEFELCVKSFGGGISNNKRGRETVVFEPPIKDVENFSIAAIHLAFSKKGQPVEFIDRRGMGDIVPTADVISLSARRRAKEQT